MAEAAAVPQQAPRHRFFCHCCKGEIDPKLPEYVCPRCESGFIEEVSENLRVPQSREGVSVLSNDDTASPFAELWQLLFMERSALLLDPVVTEPLDSGMPDEENAADCSEPQLNSRQGHAVEGIVQDFLDGLFSNSEGAAAQTPSWTSMLHSNPGDYAWGQEGLDSVVTQLLGQSENAGPPPAHKEMISSLPTVNISSEQAACRLECPVCREEFSVEESVRQLPCLHCFHSNCIVPWLQLHDTCPVCRKSLDGEVWGFQSHPEPPGTIPSAPDLQETSTFETL
ncbi:hypothetical protein DNTS_009662 [Danionella cerebrum]|uniref:RING-type E3 ubiquitin transferase n=1 Tax=Danionella cerebrum TaxID=2873325 RepID=A0A553NI60_9TELE|nr:hypothetical protein DNTS_009662 [Danionella translucida]